MITPTMDDIGKYVIYKKWTEDEIEGIIKSINKRWTVAYVTYHYNNDPYNYQNYTGAGTKCEDLVFKK